MSAGHTPGPWQVSGVRHSGDLKIGRDARLHAVGPDGDAVAMVFYDMKTGRGWKDARLIAAAPELLEALNECRGAMLICQQDHAPTVYLEAIERADAVIAKAKGAA